MALEGEGDAPGRDRRRGARPAHGHVMRARRGRDELDPRSRDFGLQIRIRAVHARTNR